MKHEFSQDISEISSNIKFHENRSGGRPDRLSDRPQEAKSRFSQSANKPNKAPKLAESYALHFF